MFSGQLLEESLRLSHSFLSRVCVRVHSVALLFSATWSQLISIPYSSDLSGLAFPCPYLLLRRLSCG